MIADMDRRWLPSFGVVACFALASVASAAPAPGADVALSGFVETKYERIGRLADLPEDVRKALSLDKSPMAEVGHDWNAGCVVDHRPRRRFIFGGKGADSWFIYSEEGGRSHFQRVVIVRRGPEGKLRIDGNWVLGAVVSDIEKLKVAVRASVQQRDVRQRSPKPL